MTLAVPLSVRLRTSRRDMHIGREVHDLSFRSVSPGGFASCTVALDRPLTLQPDEIATYGRLYVYDARNGGVAWEGRLEDPGRTAGDGGEIWGLTAIGPSAHAMDRTHPLIYIDTGFDGWRKSSYSTKSGTVETGETDDNTEALFLRIPQGQDYVAGSPAADAIYQGARETGQKLARVSCAWVDGQVSATSEQRLHLRTNGGASATVADSDTFTTTPGSMAQSVGGTGFTNGDNVANLRIVRITTSGTTTSDLNWAAFTRITVVAMRYNPDGTEKTTGYTLDTALASDIVADLLGRRLTSFDGANANVTVTSYAIDQLTYPDGVDALTVLTDLMALEPAYTWHAWESNTADLYRFEWVGWPTTVRYEADVTDGFDSPGSADGLYNACTVRWKGASGRIHRTRRTATVTDLDNAVGGALTREAMIDLGDDVGSSANAVKAGDQFLAEHATPPNAGTLTIARPIADLQAGRMVSPWEIRPGTLIRVRGVLPRVDPLNATARDGVTVFRVVAVDYNQGSNSASLELDSYPLSVARAIARANRRPVRRRR